MASTRTRRPWLPTGGAPIIPEYGFLPPTTDLLSVDQFVLEVAVDLDASDTPSTPPDVGGGGTVGAGTDPARGVSLCGAVTPIAWVELTPAGGSTTYRFAKVPINMGDPKEPRVKTFGSITRALSSPNDGQYRGATMTTVLIDHDRILRGIEDSDSLVGSRVAVFLSSEAAIRAGSTPRRVFDGIVTDSEPQSTLEFQLQVTDYLSTLLEGATQTYPQRLFTVDDFPNLALPQTGDTPGNPALIGKSVPVGYGLLSDESLGAAAQGVVPGIFTGMRSGTGAYAGLDGGLFEFVFLGHASAGIQSYFLPTGPLSSSGVAARAKYVPGVDADQSDYVFYGTSAWDGLLGAGAPPYRDFNGRRYTVAYALGPRGLLNAMGQVPLLANMGGVEDVGDGTGVMIDGLYRQVLHFIINFMLNNYTSGAWASSPVVPGELFSRVKTATFDALQMLSESYVTGGFKGAWLLGSDGAGLTFAQLVAKLALNGFAQWGQNADGQLVASSIEPSATLNRSIQDVKDVIAQSFSARRRRDQIVNRVVYKYGKRYAPALSQATPDAGSLLPTSTTVQPDPDWAVTTETTPDAASTTKYGDKPVTLELDMIRDQATADAIANLTQAALAKPPVEVLFTERLCGCDTDLSDRDELTHFEGLTSSGYVDRSMRCEVHTLDLDALDVEKQYRDLGLVDFSGLTLP
jgi:hypothetical protein